jgi:hypothetical protein
MRIRRCFIHAALICRVISLWTDVALRLVRLSFEIVRETTEFIRNVRCSQSKITQRSSRIAEKRW